MSTKSELKAFFEDGDTPDSTQFGDLIDSTLNLSESGQQVLHGTLSASALLAQSYNIDAISIGGQVTAELTSSNQFGSIMNDTHGFTGSLQVDNSSSVATFFTGSAPVCIGNSTTPQVNSGLTIFKSKTMGTSTIQATQSLSSSILITGSKNPDGITFGHLAFDTNEILHYGHNLSIGSMVNTSNPGRGNIHFIHNVGANTAHTRSLFLSSSGNVGIGTITPGKTLEVVGDISASKGIIFADKYESNNKSIAYYDPIADLYNFAADVGTERIQIGKTVNPIALAGNVSASANISASGTLFASSSLKTGQSYKVLVIDTNNGQIYHTGSFGGAGSSADSDLFIGTTSITSSVGLKITSSNSTVSPLSVATDDTNRFHIQANTGRVGINTFTNLDNRATVEVATGTVGDLIVNGPIRVRNTDARIYLEDNGGTDSNITHNASIFRLQNDNGVFKIVNSTKNEGSSTVGYKILEVNGGGRFSTALSDQGAIKMRVITDTTSGFGGTGTHAVGTSLFVIGNESFGVGQNTRTGINTDNFSDLVYALNVKGDINAIGGTVRANAAALSSDIRLKENIKDLEPQLNIIKKLQPRKYNWKKEAKIENKSDIGFVAQEIQKIIPNLVLEGKDKDKTLSISYSKLTPILVKAIQEQQEIIESLTKRIENLEKK